MIRPMCELDIPKLASLGIDYAKEANNHDVFKYDIDTAMLNLAISIIDPDSCIFVAVKENEVIGFLWGLVSPLPWSTGKLAVDNILYVVPCCRGEIHGVRLIRAYEQWAKTKNASQVSISIASSITEDRTCNLYERLGYSYIGSQFRKDI